MTWRGLVGVFIVSLLAGCGAQATSAPGTPTPTMTPRPTFTATVPPTATATATLTPTPLPPTATPTVTHTATVAVQATATPQVHVVKSGETLSGIAQAYGITVAELKKANNLQGDMINAGQELVIPARVPTATATS
jgi:LysM repeat protein